MLDCIRISAINEQLAKSHPGDGYAQAEICREFDSQDSAKWHHENKRGTDGDKKAAGQPSQP